MYIVISESVLYVILQTLNNIKISEPLKSSEK